MAVTERRRACLLTVGTGDMTRLEDSLFAPLRKSMAAGPWDTIVLLPSQVTEGFAATVCEQAPDLPIEIAPLPGSGLENDVDACFGHFDRIIGDLCRRGFNQTGIVVDFTRGTKAMSAALVLAAARHDIAEMRYIVGERDERGMVKAGTEHVSAVSPVIATGRKRLDTARQFLINGNFAAVLEILPDPDGPTAELWPTELRAVAAAVRPIATFYAAWDRLDYGSASAAEPPPADEDWADVAPTDAMRAWVRGLAAPLPIEPAGMARRLRLLAVDLLANGERRIRDRQFEDAILRAYRVLELIGQARLFARGLDSARLPADHADVLALDKKLQKKRSIGFGRNKGGTLNAGRELTARLLKQMGDDVAERLLRFDEGFPVLAVTARNTSILIHGFTATGPSDAAPLSAVYGGLETLLVDDGGPPVRDNLEIARSLDLSSRR